MSLWELSVRAAYMTRPLRPENPHAPWMARVTHGHCLRVMSEANLDPREDSVTISVGEQDLPHWDQLRVPADAVEDLARVLMEAADGRAKRIEAVALGREDCPW